MTVANAEVNLTWLSSFQAGHPQVKRQKVRSADASRTKKQNEGTVQKHFFGEYGVGASLKSIGQIDPETGHIKDPRAVLWMDEMPQALDADNQGPRTKAWGVTGEALERSGSQNRETGSVGMCFSLGGFLLGPQFNVARDHFTCALADCLDAPPWAKSFDSKIYDLDQKSRYCLMWKTDNGVQTQKSMLQWLQSIRTQMDAFEQVELVAGAAGAAPPAVDRHGQPLVALPRRGAPGVLQRDRQAWHPPLHGGGNPSPKPNPNPNPLTLTLALALALALTLTLTLEGGLRRGSSTHLAMPATLRQ